MKPCLDCGTLTVQGSRCPKHQQAANRIHDHKRRQAPGTASQQVRRALNKQGYGVCAHCLAAFHPPHLEVDHITPIWAGGHDTRDNLQILCKPCHQQKTTTENRTR